MKGVTKANPTQAVKIDKTKRPKSNLSPKERIIRREATRRMKDTKRHKKINHPAAPRGQTYKTTTKSRHRARNPAAMRRLAENMKAQILKNVIKNKSTEFKTALKHVSKQNKKQLPKKKPQQKNTLSPKQTASRAKEKRKNYQSGKHSNSKVAVKHDKNMALTKKVIVQTTPVIKPTVISMTTKSIELSKKTEATKPNVLTTKKQTTKTVSTISKYTQTTIEPMPKETQHQQINTTIAKTVIDKMLNQQILTASDSKDAKVIKRSVVKKYLVKSKKLTQVHANKTKTMHVKTVPRKLQKRSKINLGKSNSVKAKKRYKRDLNITYKTLEQATIAEFGKFKNEVIKV